jgi:PhzF family phenazine biosynthesis protein
MPDYICDWVDAFTDRPFGGNGCAVVQDGAGLDDETCKAFVRETGLVECTFTGPSDIADFRVRYFMATRELPFAGHPTLATVAALKHRGLVRGDRVTLETGAGLVPVTISDDLIEMTQIAPQFGETRSAAQIAQILRLPPDEIIGTPQMVSTGIPFCITVLRDHGALRAAKLDVEGLRALCAEMGYAGTDMMEPFLVTLKGATDQGDTFARLLLAPPNPPEDPFTGSATGAMAAYLWRHGLMDKASFIAEQGHGLGRPGQARVTRVGPSDAPDGIRVAGKAHVLMSGHLHL